MSIHVFRAVTAITAGFLVLASTTRASVVYSGVLDLELAEDGGSILVDLHQGVAARDESIMPNWDFRLRTSREVIDGSDWTDVYTYAGLEAQPNLDALTCSDMPFNGLLRLDRGTSLERPEPDWYYGGSTLINESVNGSFVNDENWASGQTGFIGLRLDGNPGWAQVTYGVDRSLVLHDFAYADAGERISVGQIPEPATFATIIGALAVCAAVYARRRRTGE